MTTRGQTLDDLRLAVTAFRDERDWRQFHTPKNLAMAVVTEAAELAELYHWQEPSEAPSADLVHRTGEEMADVLIYLLSMADVLDIDMSVAVREKLVQNASKYPSDEVRGTVKASQERRLQPKA